MQGDNLAFAEGPGGPRHQETRFTVHPWKQEAGFSREERLSGSEWDCCGIVTLAILCSVEQISNGTTCIFPSGCLNSQTAEGHRWKRLRRSSEKPFLCLPFGLVRSGPVSDASFLLSASVSECEVWRDVKTGATFSRGRRHGPENLKDF